MGKKTDLKATGRPVLFGFEASQTGYSFADCFLPGSLGVSVAVSGCNARCAFCITYPGSREPERLQGVPSSAVLVDGRIRTWRGLAVKLAPAQVVRGAVLAGAHLLAISGGEPTLHPGYTGALCRLAKEAGLTTLLLTNGITEPATVRGLAPFVDGLLLGIKGSLSAAFYGRWMGVDGACVDVVKRAALAWRESGVWMQATCLVAPPAMQDDVEHGRAEADLYAWLASDLGTDVPVSFGGILRPEGARDFWTSGPEDEAAYTDRLHRAAHQARASGLAYAADISEIAEGRTRYHCHQCGGLLLYLQWPMVECGPACTMATAWCRLWWHEQHATGGRCDHCGAEVPVRTLPAARLAANRRYIEKLHRESGR